MIYVKATQADFDEVGIPITTERFIDGKYVKHVEHLTAEQMDYMRFKARYEFIDEIPVQGSD